MGPSKLWGLVAVRAKETLGMTDSLQRVPLQEPGTW